MSLMISPGVRGAAALAGAGTGTGSLCRGRVVAAAGPSPAGIGLADAMAPLNIGAGCEPDCMNSTLVRMAAAPKATKIAPAISVGVHPSTRNRRSPRALPPAPLLPRPVRVVGLRTSFTGLLDARSRRRIRPLEQADSRRRAQARRRRYGCAVAARGRADRVSDPSEQNHFCVHARDWDALPFIG